MCFEFHRSFWPTVYVCTTYLTFVDLQLHMELQNSPVYENKTTRGFSVGTDETVYSECC